MSDGSMCWRGVIAGRRIGHPQAVERIPDIPVMGLVKVALSSPGPARAAEGLVHVKFHRLRSVAVNNVGPEIVGKMTYAVAAA